MTESIPAPQTAAVRRRPIPAWGWIAIVAGGLLVVGTIAFGVLAVFVVPGVVQRLQVAQEMKAEVDLAGLEGAARAFFIANGARWPGSLEDLVKPDFNGRTYVEGGSVPQDPWGRPYRYDASRPVPAAPRIYTLGRDGVEGGEGPDADLSNELARRRIEDR